MTDWSKPVEVDDITMAFPAEVLGKLIPRFSDLPEEFQGDAHHSHHMCKQAQKIMFKGLNYNKSNIVWKSHIDTDDLKVHALRQIKATLGSYEPKHEHKIAGVGYIMSLFFEVFEGNHEA